MTKSATPGVGLDMPKQRRWLVTGAAGFLGSNLIEALLGAGQDVIGLDNCSTGHRRNLDRVQARAGDGFSRFRLIEADTALAARELGFEAQCRSSDGIRETFRYFRGD